MPTNYRLICYILIMSICTTTLWGCSETTPSLSQIDISPFTGVPCTAPCWQGLLIDQSSESEVLSTLPTLTFINPDSIQLFRMGSAPGLNPKDYDYEAQIVAKCKYPEKQCLVLTTKNYTLTEVDLILNYEITVAEAIEYLGNPDYLGVENTGAERIMCEVYIIWSSRQLVLASAFEGISETDETCGVVLETGKVMSSLLISEARYFSSSGIEILLSNGWTQIYDFSGIILEK